MGCGLVMAGTLRGDRVLVLDKWDPVCDRAVGRQRSEEVSRRGSGELAKIAIQVRLITVTALVRDIAPGARRAHQALADLREPQHPRHGLGRQADLFVERRGHLGRTDDKLSPICPRLSVSFMPMSETHVRVSNDELATVREAMRDLAQLLDRLDRREVDKIILTQRNQMRAVLITPACYSELEQHELKDE